MAKIELSTEFKRDWRALKNRIEIAAKVILDPLTEFQKLKAEWDSSIDTLTEQYDLSEIDDFTEEHEDALKKYEDLLALGLRQSRQFMVKQESEPAKEGAEQKKQETEQPSSSTEPKVEAIWVQYEKLNDLRTKFLAEIHIEHFEVFRGDPLRWEPWQRKFIGQILLNTTLTVLEIERYLRLLTAGEARTLVDFKLNMGASPAHAVWELETQYNTPIVFLKAIQEKLRSIPKATYMTDVAVLRQALATVCSLLAYCQARQERWPTEEHRCIGILATKFNDQFNRLLMINYKRGLEGIVELLSEELSNAKMIHSFDVYKDQED